MLLLGIYHTLVVVAVAGVGGVGGGVVVVGGGGGVVGGSCCCCCRCCCRRSPVLVNIFLVQDMHICAGRKKTSSSANARLFFVSNMLLKDPLCYIYRDVGFLTWGTPQHLWKAPNMV